MTHRDIQTQERQFSTVIVDGISSWDCEKANPAQSWRIASTAGTNLTSLLTTRAAEAATRACGDGFITTCDYTITSQTPAYLGEPQVADAVAPVGSELSSSTSAYRNGTSNDMTVSFQWSKTLTNGVTFTEKHGGSVKVGLDLGKLTAGISYSYSRAMSVSTTQATVNGASAFLVVQPGEMVWVVREQLLKQTVGRFSFADAAGNAWTFDGTVIAPVESADGKTSITTFCSSNSTTAVCRTARPF